MSEQKNNTMDLPPSSPDLERAVCGGLLSAFTAGNDDHADAVLEILTDPATFTTPKWAMIFTACRDAWREEGKITPALIAQKLTGKGIAPEDLADAREYGDPYPIRRHTEELIELHRRRTLMNLAHRVTKSAATGSDNAAAIIDRLMAGASDLMDDGPARKATDHRHALQATMDRIRQGRVDRGISTGFHDLDHLTGGMRRGTFIIAAARPSVGKSAFAAAICRNVTKAGSSVALFSAEMSADEISMRLLSAESGLDSYRIESIKNIDTADMEVLRIASEKLDNTPGTLFIEDCPGISLEQLRTKARRYVAVKGVGLIVIDYLGLMRAPGAENRTQEVTKLSAGIVAMAHELNVPILAAHQLNRASENRDGKRPTMADLRDSGALEQDAHQVWLLHRESYYTRTQPGAEYDPTDPDECEIIIAKNRNGRTGIVKLAFQQSCMRFGNRMRIEGVA